MAGAFRNALSFGTKINPLNKLSARLDPAGNALGVYGADAPPPLLGDKVGEAMGAYGKDTKEADAQTMENARVTALQQGETDMGDVNRRTSSMLAVQNKRKTLFGN